MRGQRRLAHARGARDRRDDDCGALGRSALGRRGQDRIEAGQFRVAPGEARHRRRQLRWDRRFRRSGPQRGRRDGRFQRRILPQDGGFQIAQRLAGIDSQLLGKGGAQPLVGGERVGLAPAAVQRQHQLGVDLLIQRVIGHHRGQVGHDLLVPAQRQQHVGALFGGGGAQLAKPDPLGLGERPGDPGEGDATPQRERGVERGHRAGRVARLAQLAGPAQVLLEGDRVRLSRHQVQHVAGPGRDQDTPRAAQRPVGLDDPPQAGHVGIDAALGAGRGILPPDGIDELTP